MSTWTENKRFLSKHGGDIWGDVPHLYRVTTDQGIFTYRTRKKLDYKKTVDNFRKAGYTNINIFFMGRDVTF